MKIAKIGKMLPRTYENAWYYCYFRPWAKIDILRENHNFCVEKLKICEIMLFCVNSRVFQKICKKLKFRALMQGAEINEKWRNSLISLEIGDFHLKSPKITILGENPLFSWILGEKAHICRPGPECFKNQ